MTAVFLGIEYFPDPTQGRPVFNGFVFVGIPDEDPEIEANQNPEAIQDPEVKQAIEGSGLFSRIRRGFKKLKKFPDPLRVRLLTSILSKKKSTRLLLPLASRLVV